jgi:lysophospholipase L1-like esterase
MLINKLRLTMAALLLLVSAANAYSAPKTLLVVGDSLSAEYGLTRGTGWVALLQQKLKSQNLDANIVNASVSGETTSGGRTRLPALLSKHKPDVVVIELGANDGLRGLPVPAAEANLRAMVDASRKAGARVLLVGMRMPRLCGQILCHVRHAKQGGQRAAGALHAGWRGREARPVPAGPPASAGGGPSDYPGQYLASPASHT